MPFFFLVLNKNSDRQTSGGRRISTKNCSLCCKAVLFYRQSDKDTAATAGKPTYKILQPNLQESDETCIKKN